ncbi:MAG: Ig-like domain-containing protein [Ruminococcus sp.]|nr:Ig-like domain-containing protein [Ruminococcus sp.]
MKQRVTCVFSKALSFVMVLMMLLSMMSMTAFADSVEFDDSDVLANTLLLLNTQTGEVLYSKNSDVKRPMASTVKIMTCILALENIDDLSKKITIEQQPINDILAQGASTAGFENCVGDSFSALDIIYGLMLPSGCDAAQVLAYHIGGTPEKFAQMMNDKAKKLGCKNTYFVEGHGLSDENYTTAKDLAIIAEYACSLPLFNEIVSSEFYTAEGFSYPYINTNYLIDECNGRQYYYKYATGIKTGYTDASGKCLVSTAQKGDDEFMCIALGAPLLAEDNYTNHAMTDSASLYKWAFENYTENIEVEIGGEYASVEVGESITLPATITKNTTDNEPIVEWSSSDESVATVDENGVVTAHAFGQAKITAQTQTGNFDAVDLSCGFYNGIDVTSRYGDYTTGEKEKLDWKAVKADGFDFAVIRAGWGWEDYPNQNDAEFVNNVKGAYENGIKFYLSFVAYAQNEEEAKLEADYLLKEMANDFPQECKDGLIDVVYNMTYSAYQSNSKETNTAVALAFADRLKENGYDTIVFAGKSVFSRMDIDELTKESVGTYYSYYPYSFDFSTPVTTPDGSVSQMWQYRSDGYFPYASENSNTKQSVVYMLSSFVDSFETPQLSGELLTNDKLTLKWNVTDIPACSFSIYEITDSGEKVSVSSVDADVYEYTFTAKNKGEHSFVVEKVMADMISSEQQYVLSDAFTITTYHYADVDRDGDESIMDATHIQMFIAQLITVDGFEKYGDANGDGDINVMDVTYIQMYLARLL